MVNELRRMGHDVVVTARSFCNTLALVRTRGIAAQAIGRGYDGGRNTAIKRGFHILRRAQLCRFIRGQRFDVAASHSSRTQACAAARLGMPALAAADYEHADLRQVRTVRCLMVPRVVPVAAFERAGIPRAVIRPYDGLKEDVYLAGFRPAADARRRVGVAEDEILVVFRPSSDNAHYGSDSAHAVEHRLIRRLLHADQRVRVLALPRTARQIGRLREMMNGDGRLRIQTLVLDGPSLIYASDLVVSGGGTMAREAAVLGVPAICCFTGRLGAVDQHLADQGRLQLVRSVEEIEQFSPQERIRPTTLHANGAPLRQVVDAICATAQARVRS